MTYAIPVGNHVPSVPEEIFRAMQRKEMDEAEGHVFMAAWIASNPLKFVPIPYIPMSDAVSNYVAGRLKGSRGYEALECAVLMSWLVENLQRREENAATIQTLKFYKEHLAKTKMHERTQILESALQRFDRNVLSERFDEGLRVGRLDSEARSRNRTAVV